MALNFSIDEILGVVAAPETPTTASISTQSDRSATPSPASSSSANYKEDEENKPVRKMPQLFDLDQMVFRVAKEQGVEMEEQDPWAFRQRGREEELTEKSASTIRDERRRRRSNNLEVPSLLPNKRSESMRRNWAKRKAENMEAAKRKAEEEDDSRFESTTRISKVRTALQLRQKRSDIMKQFWAKKRFKKESAEKNKSRKNEEEKKKLRRREFVAGFVSKCQNWSAAEDERMRQLNCQ